MNKERVFIKCEGYLDQFLG